MTGEALFGLRFRGAVTNPLKDITDGPMFLFAGPGRTEGEGERYEWFTVMGRPQSIWASAPTKRKEIGQLVQAGKSNPIIVALRGKKVTARLHDELVWEDDIRDVLGDGVIGLVVVSAKDGAVELKNFKLMTDGATSGGGKSGVEAPSPKNYKPDGAVIYKASAAAKAAAIEQRAIGATIAGKEAIADQDGKTTGYRIELSRFDDRTPLGSFTVSRDKWVYWGGKGASHTMDPSTWRAGDRLAVVIDANSTVRLTAIFGPDSFRPDR